MYTFKDLPENAERNIIKAMITVAIGDEGKEIRNLLKKIGIDEEQKALFWEVILDQLYNQRILDEGMTDNIGHSLPVRKRDTKENEELKDTLIAIVSNLCNQPDLTSGFPSVPAAYQSEELKISDLYNKLLTTRDVDTYWNESVENLIEEILQLFSQFEENIDDKDIFSDIMKIRDLRFANAGNSFDRSNDKWVIPEKNMDGKKYSEIRNKDLILDILTNSNKIDRTKTPSDGSAQDRESFISLLMPRYGRRVEIEDLNRNFWVIAQIVDGMCSWVFEKSPLSDIIEKLLDETSQLWENILYLWLLLALRSQEYNLEKVSLISSVKIIDSEDLLRYESLPAAFCQRDGSNFKIEIPTFKFMGEDIDINAQIKRNPLKDLEDSFAHQDLCYISKVKLNNYRKNLYDGEWFDRIYFSLLNNITEIKEVETRNLISYEIVEKYYNKETEKEEERPLVISVGFNCEPIDDEQERFSPYLTSAATVDNRIFVGYPFSESGNYLVSGGRRNMYCGIRTVPMIKIYKKDNGEKTIQDFKIKIQDAVYSILNDSKNNSIREIGEYSLVEIVDNKIIMEYSKKEVSPPEIQNLKEINSFNRYTLAEIDYKEINFAYYLGECISAKRKTSLITNTQDIIENDSILLKIGNFLPSGVVSGNNNQNHMTLPVPYFCMDTLSDGTASQMRGNFTLLETPRYFSSPVNAPLEDTDDFNLNRDDFTNSFGETVGTEGRLYYYYFDWSDYLPEKDVPGSKLDLSPRTNNSMTDGVCFKTSGANSYFRVTGTLLTEEKVKKQGMSAAKYYLINTRKVYNHPHSELYRKPCTFTTFIGISPYQINGKIKQDINAICHVIRYMPHPDQLEFSEKQDNYKMAYNNFPSNELVKDGEIELGKIIYTHFVNRYDSFYDKGSFSKMLENENDQVYFEENGKEERGIYIENKKDNNYCKKITINSSQNEYQVSFTSEYECIVKYYDLLKMKDITGEIKLIKDDRYQVSEGKILLSDSLYQVEDGAICKWDNEKNFYTRRQNAGQQKEGNETNFLLEGDEENEKKYPFDNDKLIDRSGNSNTLFNYWESDGLARCEYKIEDDNICSSTSENAMPMEGILPSIPESDLPDWIIITNFYADTLSNGKYKDSNNANFVFSFCKITKEKSEKNAYTFFYNYLNENFKSDNYAESSFKWYSSKNYTLLDSITYVNDNPQFTLVDGDYNQYFLTYLGGDVLDGSIQKTYPNNGDTAFNISYKSSHPEVFVLTSNDDVAFKLYFNNIYKTISSTSTSGNYVLLYNEEEKRAFKFNKNQFTDQSWKALYKLGTGAIYNYSKNSFGEITNCQFFNTIPANNKIQFNDEEYNIEDCGNYYAICNYFGKVLIRKYYENVKSKVYLETNMADNDGMKKIYYVADKSYVDADIWDWIYNNFNPDDIKIAGNEQIKIYSKTIDFNSIKSSSNFIFIEQSKFISDNGKQIVQIAPYREPINQIYNNS